MKLRELYDYINFVTNKDQLGDAPAPDKFNLLLKAVYLEVFNKEFADFVQALASSDNNDYAGILKDGHPLKRF